MGNRSFGGRKPNGRPRSRKRSLVMELDAFLCQKFQECHKYSKCNKFKKCHKMCWPKILHNLRDSKILTQKFIDMKRFVAKANMDVSLSSNFSIMMDLIH
jgi:hypothetical protein